MRGNSGLIHAIKQIGVIIFTERLLKETEVHVSVCYLAFLLLTAGELDIKTTFRPVQQTGRSPHWLMIDPFRVMVQPCRSMLSHFSLDSMRLCPQPRRQNDRSLTGTTSQAKLM